MENRPMIKDMNNCVRTAAITAFCCLSVLNVHAWQRAQGPLQTRWANEVSPENDHPEYPRPQLVRKEWLNLNGVWGFEMTTNNAQPTVFPLEILVPFPVESALSGVMKPVS